jgi:hypothetical protein
MRALKRKNFSIFLVIFLITQNLFALTVTEDFSSGYYFDSANSTGVWNLSQRAIHPPIVIDPTYAAGVNEKLAEYMEEHPADAKEVVGKCLLAARARMISRPEY